MRTSNQTSPASSRVPALSASVEKGLKWLAGKQNKDGSWSDRGNYLFVGNTLMTCPDAASGCANARIQSGSLTNNQDFTMVNVDVDAVETGANSSSATLTLPPGSTVKYAALYWGAVSSSAARNITKLRTPASSTYSTVTAGQLDVSGTAYHAFADVTALVTAGGSGVYTVADVKATTGTNNYAGWGLVVVYAGHYATETLGVRALAEHLERELGLPWTFVEAPTGL